MWNGDARVCENLLEGDIHVAAFTQLCFSLGLRSLIIHLYQSHVFSRKGEEVVVVPLFNFWMFLSLMAAKRVSGSRVPLTCLHRSLSPLVWEMRGGRGQSTASVFYRVGRGELARHHTPDDEGVSAGFPPNLHFPPSTVFFVPKPGLHRLSFSATKTVTAAQVGTTRGVTGIW